MDEGSRRRQYRPRSEVQSTVSGDVVPDAKQSGEYVDAGDSSSNTQRKRVSQACDRCRSRKDKCDGAKPVCSTCASANHVCSYDPSTKKRGLPEGYVRGLEKLWGLTIREIEGIENVILSKIQCHDSEVLSNAWNDKSSDETLLETWRKSQLWRELEQLLPLLEHGDDKTGKRKRQDNHPPVAGDQGLSLPSLRAQTASIPPLGSMKRLPQSSNVSDRDRQGNTNDTSNSLNLDLPSDAWSLLDVYFSYTHCWFPIVEKYSLLKTSYQYPITLSSAAGSGEHAIFWAILAYADVHQKGIHKGRSNSINTNLGTCFPTKLYKRARSFVPTEDGIFELGHIQALLILTLLNAGQNRWRQAWLLVGQAVRVAIDIGLDEHPDDGKSRNRHVYLACFLLDTIVAARLRRLPQLRGVAILQHGFVQEDGLDEWNPWVDSLNVRQNTSSSVRGPGGALSGFNRLVKTVIVLNKIICDDYSDQTQTDIYTKLLEELISISNTSQFDGSLLPHQYHLNFAHLGTLALLKHRLLDHGQLIIESLGKLVHRHWIDYGLCAIPPTLDCFINIALTKTPETGFSGPSLESMDIIRKSLVEMSKVWPTFDESLNLKIFKAYSTGASSTSPLLEVNVLYGKQISDEDISSGSNIPAQRSAILDSAETPSTSSEYTPSGQAILEAAIQFDPSLLSAAPQSDIVAPSGWTMQQSDRSMPIPQPVVHTQTHLSSIRRMRGDLDGDSMFNEFATLDAMKW
jgi:hypothetical protein